MDSSFNPPLPSSPLSSAPSSSSLSSSSSVSPPLNSPQSSLLTPSPSTLTIATIAPASLQPRPITASDISEHNLVLKSPTLLLPLPVYQTSHTVLAGIYNTVQNSNGLLPSERHVLLGVLANLPLANSQQSTLLERILRLSAPNLKHLALLFESGLIAARNFGGRPTGSYPGSSGRDSIASKRPSPDSTSLDHVGPDAKRVKLADTSLLGSSDTDTLNSLPTPETPDKQLLAALEISHTLPNIHKGERYGRRQSLAHECLARQNSICPITGRKHDPHVLDAAHLVPHSVAAIKQISDIPFWRLLAVCLGPEFRDEIFSIVGGDKSFRSTNGLAIDSSLHNLFDRGVFWLIPHLDEPFDQYTTRYYDVEFRWRGELSDLVPLGTVIPRQSEGQVDTTARVMRYNPGPLRSIENGDRFRLFTNNPEEYPLTHPLLLGLHSMLWNMIASTGLSETAKAKKGRLAHAREDNRRGRQTYGHHHRHGHRSRGSRRGSRGSEAGKESQGQSSSTAMYTANLDATTNHNEHYHFVLSPHRSRHSSTSAGSSSSSIATSSIATSDSTFSDDKPVPPFPSDGDLPMSIQAEFLTFKLQQVAAQRTRQEHEYVNDSNSEYSDEEFGNDGDEGESVDEVDTDDIGISTTMMKEFVEFHSQCGEMTMTERM